MRGAIITAVCGTLGLTGLVYLVATSNSTRELLSMSSPGFWGIATLVTRGALGVLALATAGGMWWLVLMEVNQRHRRS